MFFRDELWWVVRLAWYSGGDYVAWARPVEEIELLCSGWAERLDWADFIPLNFIQ